MSESQIDSFISRYLPQEEAKTKPMVQPGTLMVSGKEFAKYLEGLTKPETEETPE